MQGLCSLAHRTDMAVTLLGSDCDARIYVYMFVHMLANVCGYVSAIAHGCAACMPGAQGRWAIGPGKSLPWCSNCATHTNSPSHTPFVCPHPIFSRPIIARAYLCSYRSDLTLADPPFLQSYSPTHSSIRLWYLSRPPTHQTLPQDDEDV